MIFNFPFADDSWLKGAHGEAACAEGHHHITDTFTCQIACEQLGLVWNGAQADNGATYPKGCYINTGASDDSYAAGCEMNTGSGGNNGHARAICSAKRGTHVGRLIDKHVGNRCTGGTLIAFYSDRVYTYDECASACLYDISNCEMFETNGANCYFYNGQASNVATAGWTCGKKNQGWF